MFIHNAFLNFHHFTSFFLLYIGPETFMPLLSALAAIAGLLMMFWRNTIAFLRKLLRLAPKHEAVEDEQTKSV